MTCYEVSASQEKAEERIGLVQLEPEREKDE
jgi:hypothetical protein